ncbi:MAG TPA: hypothetical protein VNJ52_04995 [Patescibacteria group bacterium]|nr:hypothetical protein [Patescibacteria group bacterium]
MMEEYKNKMDIPASEQKDEVPQKVTIRAVSQIKNEYHFPGSGIWQPLAVVATTIEEATHIWKQRRKPVIPEKVEEPKETNNE